MSSGYLKLFGRLLYSLHLYIFKCQPFQIENYTEPLGNIGQIYGRIVTNSICGSQIEYIYFDAVKLWRRIWLKWNSSARDGLERFKFSTSKWN